VKVDEKRVLRKISGSEWGGGVGETAYWSYVVIRGGEYGGKQKCMQGFGGQTWRKQTTSRPEAQM